MSPASGLDLGHPAVVGVLLRDSQLVEFAESLDPGGGQQVRPTLRRGRRVNDLDEGEMGFESSQGVDPVSAIENEETLLERRDDYGVTLHAFGVDPAAHAHEAFLVVVLVQDQTPEFDYPEVLEGGDQAATRKGERKRIGVPGTLAGLKVSPAAAPDEVEDQKPPEEEDRDEDHEADDAEKKVQCVQNPWPFRESCL